MKRDPYQAWWRVVRLCGAPHNQFGHPTGFVEVLLDNGTTVQFRATWDEAVEQLERYRPKTEGA
jgi:hypothetical protein